jgi:uncharacterized protein YbjT (DUF2867 family)
MAKVIVVIVALLCVSGASAFAATADAPAPMTVPTKDVVTRVAVTGATGRTGRLVVEELLNRGVEVVAMVRDMKKAEEAFPSKSNSLTIQECNLVSEEAISASLKDCDAAIWCATGFSEDPIVTPTTSVWDKFTQMVGITKAPEAPEPTKTSIDSVGIPAMAKCFAGAKGETPKVVMLSSAGVTRPAWADDKKARFPGSAEIPIVRLNPFGILGIKAESEEKLRQSDVPYCVVRPAGLNDDWPSGSRPVFSQGDVAVGRVNRKDLAKILVDVLSTPEACGKTFEAITLAGYPPANSIAPALERLKRDSAGLPDDDTLAATYTAMQQLLPGEKQDSSQIALGQTYEQMDKNEVGRFGERGAERVEEVTMKPSS